MTQFGHSCGPLTLAFTHISERIRQIELKLLTPATQQAVVEATQHSLGMGLGLQGCAAQIRQIQLLEKSHLEKRVVINDKITKLARMDYDLKKQAMIQKTIDMDEIEILRAPNAMEIDNLRIEEADILKQINESQSDLKMDMAFDDY